MHNMQALISRWLDLTLLLAACSQILQFCQHCMFHMRKCSSTGVHVLGPTTLWKDRGKAADQCHKS